MSNVGLDDILHKYQVLSYFHESCGNDGGLAPLHLTYIILYGTNYYFLK